MTTGFVFISTDKYPDRRMYNEMSMISEVAELYPLVGQYDMMVKIKSEDFEALSRTVVDKIRRIDGVVDTKTMIGI